MNLVWADAEIAKRIMESSEMVCFMDFCIIKTVCNALAAQTVFMAIEFLAFTMSITT